MHSPALKRIILGALLAAFTTTGLLAVPAQAADGGDARPCVTKREFNNGYYGWTRARFTRWFDTAGTVIGTHYDEEFVEDGYYEDDYWVSDPDGWEWNEDYQEWGYWEYGDWVDTSFWQRTGDKDVVVKYRKCASWGSGYVGIDFDNYTYRDDYGLYGLRAYAVRTNRPYLLKWWIYGDAYMRSNGVAPDKAKVLPQGHGKL